jgi:polyhydroxyalkanoate synthesis regulator phasin
MRARKTIVLATLASGLLLAFGASAASAHGGGPFGIKSTTDLTAAAAKQLGVSTDTLKKAILDDAYARIDKAVKAGKLDEDEAADLKDDLAGHVQLAVGLTTATGVARNLGITKAKLDSAYQAARKADLLAKIDQAVKDDRITADQATQLKAKIDDADLPGYKPAFGFGRHGRLFGGPLFGGFFGGPLFGGAADSSQRQTAPPPGSARS